MPQPESAVVRELYRLLATRDPAAVGAHIDATFAPDVVLSEPPSLPWGGEHTGIERVRRIFQGMAAAPPGKAPIDPEEIEIRRLVCDGAEVVAELRFALRTPAGGTVDSGAVEWFSFSGGLVAAVRASYFDSAAYHRSAA